MTKYRNIIAVFGFFCAASLSVNVFAEGGQCGFDISQSKLDVSSCLKDKGVSILKLTPRDQPIYESNLENLPTFVVVGDDMDVVFNLVGGGDTSYNNFIRLPNSEQIKSSSDASIAAKSKMTKKNWKLINMRDIVYEGAGGSDGAGVVCSTLGKKITAGYVVVSQCNAFYEADISALKTLLDLVGDQSK